MSSVITPSPQAPAAPPAAVPTRKRFFWGLGGVVDQLVYNNLNGLMDSIYVNAMGLSPTIIGLARSVPRLLDLVTDPFIGHLSDNTRSRWGRRRPWMFVGALITAFCAVMMWYPPTHCAPWITTTFVVGMCVLLLTLGYSMFMIPYTAQGYELSTDYNERNHVFKWRLYCFAAIGFFGPWILALCLKLEGPMANVTRGANAIHTVSLIIAAVVLLAACGPIFGCRERGEHAAEKKIKFREALWLTLRNKAFWPLVAGNFFAKFGMAVTGSFFYYVMVYHVSAGDNSTGAIRLAVFSNTYNVATFAGMALMVRFTDRVGKKPALLTLLLLSALAYLSVYFTLRPQTAGWVLGVADFLHQTFAIPVFIGQIWPLLVTALCIGCFTFTMPMVMNSMLADVCDVDELECGQQRQAFYSAMFVTCDKLAVALAMFLQGLLVAASGFSAKLATQAPETIGFWMKALLFTQPVGFSLGFLCVLAYPITRAKALEVRRLIDARKASK